MWLRRNIKLIVLLFFCLGIMAGHFSDEGFISFLGEKNSNDRVSLYKQIAATVSNFKTFNETRYGKYAETVTDTLSELGEIYLSLSVDPGLAFYVKEFAQFVTANHLLGGDPWDARKKFAEHLGSVTVYRGLALQPQEFEAIRKQGILSGFVRNAASFENYDRESVAIEMLTRVESQLVSLTNRSAEHDPLLSVTPSIKTAACVAGAGFKFPKEIDRSLLPKIYVFKIKLPKIDILDLLKHPETCEYAQRDSEDLSQFRGEPSKTRKLLCMHALYPASIEAFVPLIIDTEEIMDYKIFPIGSSELVAECDNEKMLLNNLCHRHLPLKDILPQKNAEQLVRECTREKGYLHEQWP